MLDIVDIRVLAALEPISSFSPARLRELLDNCHVENMAQGRDPFQAHPPLGQSVYLLRGELEVVYDDGNRVLIRADSEWARQKAAADIRSAQALSSVQLLCVAAAPPPLFWRRQGTMYTFWKKACGLCPRRSSKKSK